MKPVDLTDPPDSKPKPGKTAEKLARQSSKAVLFLYAALAIAFLVLTSRSLATRLRFEDALIVLRYARNLVAGEGFVFNPGERVLGVTTPLYTLFSTLFIPLGREGAATAQNVAGLVFLLLGGFLVLLLFRRTGHPWLGLLAAVLAICNFHRNYLYIGMEIHAFTFLLLLAYTFFLDRRQIAVGIVLGTAFLVRYDAALMAALLGLAFLVEERKLPWRLATAFFVTVLPWLVFAQLYFGSVLPQSLAAKADLVSATSYLRQVAMYYQETIRRVLATFLPWRSFREVVTYGSYGSPLVVAVGIGWWVRRDRRHLVLAIYPLLHLLVYAGIGADPGFSWHYYILNPEGLLLLVAGGGAVVRTLADRLPAERKAIGVSLRAAAIVLFLALFAPLLQRLGRGATREYQPDPHSRQFYAIGEWLRDHYDEDTSLLQPSIGILGYVSGLRIVDHAGLVTPGLRYFDDRRCTPLSAVLDGYAPDLVLLNQYAAWDPLEARGYRLVRTFDGPAARYHLFSAPGVAPPS